jgi:PKD repeat protein
MSHALKQFQMKRKLTLVLFVLFTSIIAKAQPTMMAGSVTIPMGGTAEVSYTVNDFWNITIFNGTVTWDPAVVSFSAVTFLSTPFSNYPATFNTSQTANGILSFTWFHPFTIGATIPDGDPVFKITFTGVGGQGTTSTMGFSSTPEPIYYENFSVQSGAYATVNGLATISGGSTNPPVANFTWSGSGLNWYFTSTSTGSPTSYLWSFGDGNTSTQQNPTYSYATGGTYQVCLTATNANGSDSTCHMVYAVAPPVANFTVGGTGLYHSFTSTSTGNPTSYSWTFGDGGTSTLQNPTHTYAAYGTYQVCLTVSNSFGNDSTCHMVYATMTVGLEDQESIENFNIAYLPESQVIQVNADESANSNFLVEVYSVQGQLLISGSTASGSLSLPVQNLGSGICFVRMTAGNEVITRKLFVY